MHIFVWGASMHFVLFRQTGDGQHGTANRFQTAVPKDTGPAWVVSVKVISHYQFYLYILDILHNVCVWVISFLSLQKELEPYK